MNNPCRFKTSYTLVNAEPQTNFHARVFQKLKHDCALPSIPYQANPVVAFDISITHLDITNTLRTSLTAMACWRKA